MKRSSAASASVRGVEVRKRGSSAAASLEIDDDDDYVDEDDNEDGEEGDEEGKADGGDEDEIRGIEDEEDDIQNNQLAGRLLNSAANESLTPFVPTARKVKVSKSNVWKENGGPFTRNSVSSCANHELKRK